ncbi:RNA polymerase sigma factor [Umezawaea sp. Da 62-37]|uniref:RNA polymerase sigma factor n=1 Tax=Umezawaea sp. Da 62-37 TaxID=3075927 RepID=UPI0037DC8BD0
MPEHEDPGGPPDDRVEVLQALEKLPPGQRAVVVLKYWEDQSITETARLLGRTEGTVKSQASKGLTALRALLRFDPTAVGDQR